jgi:predicted nucleic acid-binding protein
MSAEAFIDSNVILYLFDEIDDAKRVRAESLVYESLEKGSGCISFQVVQETLNVVTRKLGTRPEAALRLLDEVLVPLWSVLPSAALYQQGVLLQERYRLSFYDSLIVAAALQAGCSRIYSEDMQHGQQVEAASIVNPFLEPVQGGRPERQEPSI